MTASWRNTILAGDATEQLRTLPSHSIDCVITSPPYYQLRDYGVSGQLGLEANVTDWVEGMCTVMREIARVIKPTGSLWLNLGDSYSRHARHGAPPKSLLLGPERLLVALAGEGWIVRNRIVWAKTNPMPTAVNDRLDNAHDLVYLLARRPHYFFDLNALREPAEPTKGTTSLMTVPIAKIPTSSPGEATRLVGRNPGDVWHIPAANYRGAHFATFPPALVERPLLATCPERICTGCGTPWTRTLDAHRTTPARNQGGAGDWRVRRYPTRYRVIRRVGPAMPQCDCDMPTRPGVVLDPFFGSGTVGEVAQRHGRDWVGIELNPTYRHLAYRRISRSHANLTDRQAA